MYFRFLKRLVAFKQLVALCFKDMKVGILAKEEIASYMVEAEFFCLWAGVGGDIKMPPSSGVPG